MEKENNNKDIAIIGMAAKLPNANDPDEFWENLVQEKDCKGVFPEQRKKDFYDYVDFSGRELKREKKSWIRGANNADKFDYKFFNFSPREAELTDPAQRNFLEVTWSALEDSGYAGERIKGGNVGVFVGFTVGHDSYGRAANEVEPDTIKYTSPSNMASMVGGRTAYFLDLKGPSMMIDTACSSSLVAIYEAYRSINNGECDSALAGGCKFYYLPSNLGRKEEIESRENITRTFDDSSDGTDWGEGTIVFFLKPLKKALKDRDNIQAVIKGGAVNQDGRSLSITAPNPQAQSELIKKAWRDSDIDPETISYIETHGTGTPTGDPTEIKGIIDAFREFTDRKQFCGVGSAKPNIGHLDVAAGAAGVLKTVLALKNEQIPASINFNFPNRRINFIDSPVFVNDKLRQWKRVDNSPRRGGVSAFGFSGTNCHLILEEAPKIESSKEEERDILTFSAQRKEGLYELAREYISFLDKGKISDLNDLCYTANTGRYHCNYRAAIIAEDTGDLRRKLEQFLQGEENKYIKKEDPENFSWLNEEVVLTREDRYDLEGVATKYIQGSKIVWGEFYTKEERKISLPTYPFEKTRCWIKFPERSPEKGGQKKLGLPLLRDLLAESLDQKIFRIFLDPDKSEMIKEHKVGSNLMLVGMAYLEMVVEACGQEFGFDRTEIKEAEHLYPMIFNKSETKEVHLILHKNQKNYSISVASRSTPDGNWTKHFQCDIELKETQKPTGSLGEIFKEFQKDSIQTVYEVFNDKALDYGDRWNSVKKIHYKKGENLNEKEALIELGLKDEYRQEAGGYYFYPPLFDRMVFLDVVKRFLGTDDLYLPRSFKSIELNQKLPPEFYSYVHNCKQDDSGKFFFCDVSLWDRQGGFIGKINEYCLERSSRKEARAAQYDFFYQIEWKQEGRSDAEAKKDLGTTLVFKGQNKRVNEITEKLNSSEIIEIELGDEFCKTSENKYVLANKQEDYDKLFKDLAGRRISTMIHSLALENSGMETLNGLKESQEKGAFSLFRIVKGLQNSGWNKRELDITLLTSSAAEVTGEEERIAPENASLLGLGKVVNSEEENLKCFAIDTDKETGAEELVSEINSEHKNHKIAYRNNQRYVEVLGKKDLLKTGRRKKKLKPNGVYVITGGTGALGLETAKYLASLEKVNLVLLNRSQVPKEEDWKRVVKENKDEKLVNIIKNLQEIKDKGSKVVCKSCDISDRPDLKNVLNNIREEIGSVDGVIHCAGVAGRGLIYNKKEEDFKDRYKTKVYGTWILDELTRQDEPDFFINFSSSISVLAPPGQSDYASANSFLDSFSFYRNKKNRPTTTINWGAWKDMGMASYGFEEVIGPAEFLTTREAIDCFDRIFSQKDIKNVIIEKIDLYKNYYTSDEPREKGSGEKEGAVELTGRESGEYSYWEREVAQVWREILGYSEFNINDNFFELGGDSLSAIRSLSALNKRSGLELSLEDFSDNPSIAMLAARIGSEAGEKGGSDISETNQDDQEVKGGKPFTGVGDFLEEHGLSKRLPETADIKVDINLINPEKLLRAFKKLSELRTGISFNLLMHDKDNGYYKLGLREKDALELNGYSHKKDPEELKQILEGNTEGKEINCVIADKDNLFYFLFSRDKDFIKDDEFSEILMEIQKIYNLHLIGIEVKELKDVYRVYTPYLGYPSYYECHHSSLIEKIRWETGKRIRKNFFPVIDLSCLPNYFVIDKKRRSISKFNHLYLGAKSFEYFAGFKKEFKFFDKKDVALQEFFQRSQKGEVVILGGLNYYIPGSEAYHNKDFFALVKDKRIIDGTNAILTHRDLQDNFVVYSSVVNYFGQIKYSDLLGFWTNSAIPRSENDLGKIIKGKSFWLWSYSDPEKIKETTPDLVREGLKFLVKEFYNNTIVNEFEDDDFEKAYFGRQALSIFRQEVADNLDGKDRGISDIVIVDILKRLNTIYIFLHNFLLEVMTIDNSFYAEVQETVEIFKKLKGLSSELFRDIHKKGFSFNFKDNVLPPNDLYGESLLDKKNKEKTLRVLDNIIDIQERLFLSLSQKIDKN